MRSGNGDESASLKQSAAPHVLLPLLHTCVNSGVLSAMILIASLLAPTVPSAPMPQNMHCRVPAGMVLMLGPSGRWEWVTSSMMPT